MRGALLPEGRYARSHVLSQTFAVYPGLGAVIVAHIKNAEYIGEVTAVEPVEHEHLGLRVESHGHRVGSRAGVASVRQFTGLIHITFGALTTGLTYFTSDTEL